MENLTPNLRSIESEEDISRLQLEILKGFKGLSQASVLRMVQERTGFATTDVVKTFLDLANQGAFIFEADRLDFVYLSPIGQALFESYYPSAKFS